MERDNLYNSVFENNQPSVINIDDEEEGEDLFNDNYMKDYKLMDGNGQYDDDQYDLDLDQILRDRSAADAVLSARENRNHNLFHDNDNF